MSERKMARKTPTEDAEVRLRGAKGGLSGLAEKLGVYPATVSRWMVNGIPDTYVVPVETLTGIGRAELRPDLYE